jgi:hypothetical protein
VIQFTHEQLLGSEPPAGLTPRLASLVASCAQVARECVEAADGGADYFDEGGLRFAVVTGPGDLLPGGPLAEFLGVGGDPLPAVLDRVEGSHRWIDDRAHVLLLSVGDTTADYIVLPDEHRTPAWAAAIDDLHPAELAAL